MAKKGDASVFHGVKVNGRWALEKQLGVGSFGQVWLARDMSTKQKVAIKLESQKEKELQIFLEFSFYKALEKSDRIPKIYKICPVHDNKNEEWCGLVMECMGNSLDSLSDKYAKFSLKSTIQVTIQMLHAIEAVHSAGIVHRDIKPDNFMFGLKENNGRDKVLCMIDFGLAKYWRNPDTGKHIANEKAIMILGTARYMSANAQTGMTQSRRDDLISIGYLMVFFAIGRLPWQGLDIDDSRKRSEVTGNMKNKITATELCKGLPSEFTELVRKFRCLRFEETPDYAGYRKLMQTCAENQKITLDDVYDWDV